MMNHKKNHIISTCAALVSVAFFSANPRPASAQDCPDAGWQEYESNPIVDPEKRAYYPTVLYDADLFGGHGESKAFKMWVDVDFQYYVSDDGVEWTFVGDTEDGTITGLGDTSHNHVEYYADGFAGQEGGDPTMYYRLWYWDDSYLYAVEAIGYAESPDGKAWYNEQEVAQDIPNIIIGGNDPFWNRGTYGPIDVLYNPDATNTGENPFDYSLVMYYEGTTGGQETTGMGYSADGINWIGYDGNDDDATDELLGLTENTDWDYNYTTFGTILVNDDGFRFWYSGGSGASNHGIGLATSPDGITWTRDGGNPIFHKDDGVAWRDERTYTPSIVDVDGQLMMYFTGKDTASGNYTVGLATYYSGGCSIDDQCYEDGEVNSTDPCQICDIALSTDSWSPNDGNSCDDGLFCNGVDTCSGGACISSGDPCLANDDGLFCTGEEYCDEVNDICTSTDNPCGDDWKFCNGVESCDEVNDQCVSSGNPCVDDGLFCNGVEECDELFDICQSSGDPCWDDLQFCNGVEYCDEDNDQCATTGDPCPKDALWCNGIESCDEENDQCLTTGDPCPKDAIFCNGEELCDERRDECVSTGNPCGDDGLFCNGLETCDEHLRECVSSGDPCQGDELFCNGVEECDESSDTCVSSGSPCAEGETCDEGEDTCEPEGAGDEDAGIDYAIPFTAFSGVSCDCSSFLGSNTSQAKSLIELLIEII